MATVLEPQKWAVVMLFAGFPANAKVIAEGLAVLEQESGFDYTITSDGIHIGGWQEEDSFGSKKEREDPMASTKAARARWEADGNSFYGAWGKWDGSAEKNYKKWLSVANKVVREYGDSTVSQFGRGIGGFIDDTADTVTEATDFVGDAISTLLNFRKLGELLAKAFAWWVRLVLKAVWDYCISPLVHWNERAVTYYYQTFFSYEKDSGRTGFNRVYRENAGIVTMIFWGLGYGILWTTPDSPLKPANSPRDSILGRSVRAIEGKVARRNLVKPKDVKAKTPPKPEPKESIVKIDKTRDFHTARRRPVSVEGRRSTNHAARSRPGRPGPKDPGKTTIILPPGVASAERKAQRPPKPAAKQSRPRVDSQPDSRSHAKSTRG